jgi:hypothetical protein
LAAALSSKVDQPTAAGGTAVPPTPLGQAHQVPLVVVVGLERLLQRLGDVHVAVAVEGQRDAVAGDPAGGQLAGAELVVGLERGARASVLIEPENSPLPRIFSSMRSTSNRLKKMSRRLLL